MRAKAVLIGLMSLIASLQYGFVQGKPSSWLAALNRRANSGDDQQCEDLGNAFVAWWREWLNNPDFLFYELDEPVSVEQARQIFQSLGVDLDDAASAKEFACNLIGARSVEQIKTLLKNRSNQWFFFFAILDRQSNAAEATARRNLHRQIYDDLVRLGYPQWPLPASREDVQEFLDRLDNEYNYDRRFAYNRVIHDDVMYGSMTDYYIGEQSYEDFIKNLNFAVDEDYSIEHVLKRPIHLAQRLDNAGWPLLNAWADLQDSLWNTGVGETLISWVDSRSRKRSSE